LSVVEFATDVKVTRYPDLYMGERGVCMWNIAKEMIDEPQPKIQ